MFLLNLKNNEFFVLLLKNLQYKMFLLNPFCVQYIWGTLSFTIQNVSIKLNGIDLVMFSKIDLQYKMFLLNSTANNNASLNVLFTIQNVSIKLMYDLQELDEANIYNTKCFY